MRYLVITGIAFLLFTFNGFSQKPHSLVPDTPSKALIIFVHGTSRVMSVALSPPKIFEWK